MHHFGVQELTTMPDMPAAPVGGALLTRAGNRRTFLRSTAVTAVLAGALSACKGAGAAPEEKEAGPAPAPAAPPSPRAKADAMDAMHEARMKAFPAKTAGTGNQ